MKEQECSVVFIMFCSVQFITKTCLYFLRLKVGAVCAGNTCKHEKPEYNVMNTCLGTFFDVLTVLQK